MHTRKQSYCNRCGQPTLHEREVEKIPHLIHFALTILCCGLWLPVWILLAAFPQKYAWMCSICGQIEGDVPPEIIEAEQERRRIYKEQERIAREQEKSSPEAVAARQQRATEWAARRQAVGDMAAAGWRGIVKTVAGAGAAVNATIGRLSGGDVFMYWFFWVILGGSVAVIAAVLVVSVVRVWSA